jgi:hypothetical protein
MHLRVHNVKANVEDGGRYSQNNSGLYNANALFWRSVCLFLAADKEVDQHKCANHRAGDCQNGVERPQIIW